MTSQAPSDPAAEPAGFVVEVTPGERIHFLDWGGTAPDGRSGVLLIHGLSNSAWSWSPVARRLAEATHVVAMDLPGHGLSDAPTEGYDEAGFGADVEAVAEGAGLLGEGRGRVVLAGHGFGGIVATWAARRLADRGAGVVLVDGGWESAEAASGVDVEEFLRTLDEPPEVMRSLASFLKDRAGFDPATWDADQERAARATVVETHAGRVVPSTRPHARDACVRAMFEYDPVPALAAVNMPVIALVAGEDVAERLPAVEAASAARAALGLPAITTLRYDHVGHNLMRYRAEAVVDAVASLALASMG